MCIAFGTVLALKLRSTEQLRRRRLRQPNDSQFDKPFSTRPGNLNLPIKDKISLPLGVGDLDDIYDDKNPDVVPYNEGKDTFFSLALYIACLFVYTFCSIPIPLPSHSPRPCVPIHSFIVPMFANIFRCARNGICCFFFLSYDI